MPGLDRAEEHDEGFSLIEVVVALVMLGAIAAASAVFFTRASVATSEQQRRQAATALVQSALDDARVVAPATLLNGRTQAAVTAQWNASQAPDKAVTIMAWDTAASPTPTVAVPLTTTSVVSNQTYTVSTLIGVCYRIDGQLAASDCTTRNLAPTNLAPTNAAPAGALTLYRVIVEVSWKTGGVQRACNGGACVVRSSTIIDPSADTRWSVLSAPTAFSSTETFDARTGSSTTLPLRTLVDAGNTDADSQIVVSSVGAQSAFLLDNAAYPGTRTAGRDLAYQLPPDTVGSFRARYFVRNTDGQVSRTVTKTVVARPVVTDDTALARARLRWADPGRGAGQRHPRHRELGRRLRPHAHGRHLHRHGAARRPAGRGRARFARRDVHVDVHPALHRRPHGRVLAGNPHHHGGVVMPRRSAQERDSADAGMTLIELTVAMVIFTICMSVFLAAILQMTSATVRAQTVANNGDQLRGAFTRMDSQLRAAEAVNAPGIVGQSWFLEFRTPGFDGASSTCTQWRYSVARGVLEQRQWDGAQAPPVQWTALASGLSKDPAVLATDARRPFAMTPASSTRAHQSVAVLLESLRKGTRTSATSGPTGEQLRATFTALNSDASSDGNVLLAGGASKNPACSATTTRTE